MEKGDIFIPEDVLMDAYLFKYTLMNELKSL